MTARLEPAVWTAFCLLSDLAQGPWSALAGHCAGSEDSRCLLWSRALPCSWLTLLAYRWRDKRAKPV